MRKLFKRFLQDKSGATAIEYGLIASLIAVVLVVSLTAVGGGITAAFNTVTNAIHAALN